MSGLDGDGGEPLFVMSAFHPFRSQLACTQFRRFGFDAVIFSVNLRT